MISKKESKSGRFMRSLQLLLMLLFINGCASPYGMMLVKSVASRPSAGASVTIARESKFGNRELRTYLFTLNGGEPRYLGNLVNGTRITEYMGLGRHMLIATHLEDFSDAHFLEIDIRDANETIVVEVYPDYGFSMRAYPGQSEKAVELLKSTELIQVDANSREYQLLIDRIQRWDREVLDAKLSVYRRL